MPTIDWLHLAAVALGAVGTFFLQGKSAAGGTAAAGLLDSLLKVLESRLAPSPATPNGKAVPSPLMTLRVLLVSEPAEAK